MPTRGERLSVLAALVGGTVHGGDDPLVTDVTHDSRQAGPGCAFVAVRGARHDGQEFIPAAVASGSPAVVAAHPVDAGVPVLVVDDPRRVLGPLAAAVHGHPAEEVDLIGVTGTNGKTSVTYMVDSIARAAGIEAGVIGTIQTRVGGEVVPMLRTTPEASDFQRLLRLMADRGARLVAAEVSSHALDYGRVDATRFDVAAFTNLSQDHLDFHGDMESYYRAKAALFTPERARRAVIWIDDPHGRRLAAETRIPSTTVAIDRDADIRGRVSRQGRDGSLMEIDLPGGTRRLHLPLVGGFAVANALIAAASTAAVGVDIDAIVAGLERTRQVPGRFEVVSGDDAVIVVVDYAHTPAGIDGAIAVARQLATGRVIAVVGAGGDRDRAKRPLMGAAAAAADLVIVTSDNPRSEDPSAIIDAVMEGIPAGSESRREPDRREAIAAAVAHARAGDVVLVLGKGHERGQEIGGIVHPFDDREVARTELARIRGASR